MQNWTKRLRSAAGRPWVALVALGWLCSGGEARATGSGSGLVAPSRLSLRQIQDAVHPKLFYDGPQVMPEGVKLYQTSWDRKVSHTLVRQNAFVVTAALGASRKSWGHYLVLVGRDGALTAYGLAQRDGVSRRAAPVFRVGVRAGGAEQQGGAALALAGGAYFLQPQGQLAQAIQVRGARASQLKVLDGELLLQAQQGRNALLFVLGSQPDASAPATTKVQLPGGRVVASTLSNSFDI